MRNLSLCVAAFAAMFAGAANAVVVTDCCDWASGWNFSSFGANGGTATATVEAAGGNPGARLNITTVTPTPPATLSERRLTRISSLRFHSPGPPLPLRSTS